MPWMRALLARTAGTAAWLTLLLAGCSVEFGGSDGNAPAPTEPLACPFDYARNTSYPRIASDDGLVDARMRCVDVTDCADLRSVLHHASLELAIVVPPDIDPTQLGVISRDETRLRLTPPVARYDACHKQHYAYVTLHFDGVGEAALVVLDGARELARFTWSSFDPAVSALELQDELTREWSAPASYALLRTTFVRARVENDAGERLLCSGMIHYWVDDGRVATLWGGLAVTGRGQVIGTTGAGSTQLHLLVGNIESQLELEVRASDAATLPVLPVLPP